MPVKKEKILRGNRGANAAWNPKKEHRWGVPVQMGECNKKTSLAQKNGEGVFVACRAHERGKARAEDEALRLKK